MLNDVKSGTQVSDASVHMDYYIALHIKAQDGHKVYWDSRKQAARFSLPPIRFKIRLLFVMQI